MITLDGKTDKELGIRILESYEHPEPSTRDITVEIPGRHGEYDFGADLSSLVFNFPVLLEPQLDKYALSQKIKDIKKILLDPYGKPRMIKLVFDEEPDKFYMVRYSGSYNINKLLNFAQFELPLKAFDPFKKFVVNTDEIKLDSDIPVLSDITIGAEYSYTITSSQVLNIINDGSLVVRPKVLINGSANSLTLSINGESFSFGSVNSSIEVDAETYTVLPNLSAMSGNIEKLELLPGDNFVSVSGSGLNVNITFSFKHKYM